MYSLHNIHFKQPVTGNAQPERSPSPPHSYVEPLSPSNFRPRPIEPNFNYPAVGNKEVAQTQQHTEAPQWQHLQHAADREHSGRRGHFRKPSSMDALADAALAVNRPTRLQHATAEGLHHDAYYQVEHVQHGGYSVHEPAYKRARTDTHMVVNTMTLYGPTTPQADQERLNYDRERHLEAAAMLLNFSSTGARVQPTMSYAAPYLQDPPRLVSDSMVQPIADNVPAQDIKRSLGQRFSNGLNEFEHHKPALPPHRSVHNALQRPPSMPAASEQVEAVEASPSLQTHSPNGSVMPLSKKSRKRSQKPKSATKARSIDLDATVRSSSNLFGNPSLPASLPSPQQTHESNGLTPEAAGDRSDEYIHVQKRKFQHGSTIRNHVQQTLTPPEEIDHAQRLPENSMITIHTVPPKRRGWPKGKPRGPSAMKGVSIAKRNAARKRKTEGGKAAVAPSRARRNSTGTINQTIKTATSRAHSVPPQVAMIIHKGPAQRKRRNKPETSCAGCRVDRKTATGLELDDWISCNGCKQWFHLDCAGFKNAVEVRDVDKYFCTTCEAKHGKTTYVRKSRRAHTSVDYAELQKGVLKTSDESHEHHYIQPIKDGSFTFDPESFPRVRPELLTRDYFERGGFVEPVCIPAAWNPRPWGVGEQQPIKHEDDDAIMASSGEGGAWSIDGDEFEYDCVTDEGQDALDMIMPKGLTVRKVCDLVGPHTPLDVIDVKTQNSGAKWNLARWAEYYESDADDKPVRNVISLEVSHTKLGRLLRRPKVVRDIDLQDQVWPQEEIDKGKWPKVQYYCLMSIADSYTDFHIDFGGSSVYYHLIKGKKTFFFIPPKPKHLKAYEEWNNNPQQNFTFLPDITKECYRVDLCEGDTMLIPSGWIHAVWTPETSLVIGGNFLTRMSFKNQFKVAEIEKNNDTPQKFRYPFFQRLMWWTAIDYMERDPMPEAVDELFMSGQQFQRDIPSWQDFDEQDDRPGASNTRYYSQAELDGLPDLVNFIFRTVLISQGCLDGIPPERVKRVAASIPVPKRHDGPLQLAKAFALWVAWKRGNEDPPAWAHPTAMLPTPKDDPAGKKLSAREVKDLEKKEAIAASAKQRSERQAKRAQKEAQVEGAAQAEVAAASDATMHDATSNFEHSNNVQHATFDTRTPSATSSPMLYAQSVHQEGAFPALDGYSPDPMAPTTMMMTAFHSQHISTPKTSVLGPRRVACDPCRKRRIKCKHKEFVVQASPDSSLMQLQQNVQSFGASGAGDLSPQAYITTHQFDGAYDDAVNGSMQPLGGKLNSSTSPAPGTNAYISANIPMALNGVPLFGDAKRGRSKACFECRKSKRRCIHDEHGNVDPIKAAETPVPRQSSSTKKRASEEGSLDDAKRLKVKSATPQPAGIHGVLRPIKQSPTSSEWSQYSPASADLTGCTNQTLTSSDHSSLIQSTLPIDPSLVVPYHDANQLSTLADDAYAFLPYSKPSLVSLPSLEQIAADVLDMDGGAGDAAKENTEGAFVQHTDLSRKSERSDDATSGADTSPSDLSTFETDSSISSTSTGPAVCDTSLCEEQHAAADGDSACARQCLTLETH